MALPLPGAAARDDLALANVLGQAAGYPIDTQRHDDDALLGAMGGQGLPRAASPMGMRAAIGMMGAQAAQSAQQRSDDSLLASMTQQQFTDDAVLNAVLKQDAVAGARQPVSRQGRNDDNILASILGQSPTGESRQRQDDAKLSKFRQSFGRGAQLPHLDDDDAALLNLLESTTSSSARKYQGVKLSAQPPSPSMVMANSLNDVMLGFPRGTRAEVVAGGNGKGCQPHQLFRPLGIALDGQRGLLVADNGNHRVVRWGLGATRAPRGEVVIDSRGYGHTWFDPLGLAVVGQGGILVSVSGGIELWERGVQAPEVIASGNWPAGLAVDPTGSVLFADMLDHCVRQTPSSNAKDIVAGGFQGRAAIEDGDWQCPPCAGWHSRRSRACQACNTPRASWQWTDQLHRPFGITIDRAGSGIFVADSANHRVVHWALGASQGVVVAGGKGPGNRSDQLHCPRGVALDGSGALLVADTLNHRVMRFANPLKAPDGGTRSRAKRGELVAGGCGPGQRFNQLNQPNCIVVDGEGALYIADTGNHRVVRWYIYEQY